MARKRKSLSRSTVQAPRDPSAIASRDVDFIDLVRLRPLNGLSRSGRSLREIEDRRMFHPSRVTVSRTPRQVARILATAPRSNPKAKALHRQVLAFRLPETTAVCVRREIRKQVIHARGVAGGRVRKPKRNMFSAVSCRRK